jgi:hypothetical protein
MPEPDKKKCEKCGRELDRYDWSKYCGALVCPGCDHHQGLARCYCGWSVSGRNGRTELIELGETIDPEPGVIDEQDDYGYAEQKDFD